MDQNEIDWIGQYLDRTQPDGWTAGASPLATGGPARASADAGREFVTAYLDWMGLAEPVRAAPSPYRAAARRSVKRGGDMAGLDVFEEVLLSALRTEWDRIESLRGILVAGKTPPHIVQFASKTLMHAERRLKDERRAWCSLAALRHTSFAGSRAASDETQWPRAFEQVAVDVRALQGTVLAMQRHW